MSEDIKKLQRMLEQATAAELPEDGLDPETASLREAWIGFGQLLGGTEASVDGTPFVWSEKPMFRPVRPRRPMLPVVALVAASLLIGIVTAWMFNRSQRFVEPTVVTEQTVAVDTPSSTPREEPQWDDSFDEWIAKIDQQMVYSQQDAYLLADASGIMQYQMEQMQQDLEGGGL